MDKTLRKQRKRLEARRQSRDMSELVDSLTDLISGRPPMTCVGTNKASIAERVLKRNQNGIGATDIQYDPKKTSIVLNPQIAERGVTLLSGAVREKPELFSGAHARKERGSIEGQILQVGTYYNEPAIKFRERKSDIALWCRVSKSIEEQIARQADFADVWNHRRVIVRGLIEYDSDGRLARVFAESIERVKARKVSPSELRDPNFTGGLSISEYLDKFREGELGR